MALALPPPVIQLLLLSLTNGAVSSFLRTVRPILPGSPAHLALSFGSLLIALAGALLTLRLRRLRRAARSPVHLGEGPCDGDKESAGSPLQPPLVQTSDTLMTEVFLVVVAVSAFAVAAQDAWYFARNLYTFGTTWAPDCYVMDHGVILRETCEHWRARVGEENIFTVEP